MTSAGVTSAPAGPGGSPAPSPRPRARLAHLPALDGLRAIALLGVLAFHSELDEASGGFLGVSLFFTLSGYLITRLLLDERARTGRTDLARFWSRRARRLLPAAFAGVVVALAVGYVIGDTTSAASLRGDALATLGYVANWRFVLDDRAYADLFGAPSPLLHMWSLAIEEQLYLVVPLLVAVLARRSTRALAGGVAGLAVASAIAGALLSSGEVDRAYYGTDVRAVELLVGVLLAIALHGRTARADRTAPSAVVRWLVGPLALAGVVISWTVADVTDPALYRGGLLAHAIATCLVLWAVQAPGPLTAGLSLAPLRWLGTRSYGAYVYHWPVFLLLTPDRAGVDGAALHALRLVAVLAMAEVSYRVLEQPIRTGRALTPARARLGAATAIPVVAALALALPQVADPAAIDFDAAQRSLDEAVAQGSTDDAGDGSTDEGASAIPPDAPRLAIYGDSTALLAGTGLTRWARETGAWRPVEGVTSPGCPLVVGGARRMGDQVLDIAAGCAPDAAWPERLAATDPDVVLIQAGSFDTLPWRPPGAEAFLAPSSPQARAALRTALDRANELLLEHAELVVWLTSPPVVDATPGDLERFALWNELVAAAADRPGVTVVDLAGHLAATPGALDDPDLRPDGTHFTEDTSYALASDWLGPAVAGAVAAARTEGPES